MGHQRLGRLPASKRWTEVVALIAGGADVATVAAATSKAAEAGMRDVGDDEAVRLSFWLLTQVPLAARGFDFVGNLRDLGIDVPEIPTIDDVAAGVAGALDRMLLAAGGRSDYGEMAQVSVLESLRVVASQEPELIDSEDDGAQRALANLASPRRFAILARDFFSRLTHRHLAYFLSREIANHTGPGHRFPTLADHDAFEQSLDRHCREASRIIKEFSAEWFSKQNYEGGIDPGKAGRFVHVAAGKIRAELKARQGVDA